MQKKRLTYIPTLDGLRTIAVSLVLLLHFGLIDFGWLGVQMFFVLSGYLITGGLLMLKLQQTSILHSLKVFYYRRALRIFPLYYFYLFIILLCSVLFFNNEFYFKHVQQFFPWLYTYTYNLTKTFDYWQFNPLANHFWSLCVEEQFYLIWPFFILFFNNKINKYTCIALVVFVPVFRHLFLLYLSNYRHLFNEGIPDAINWFTFNHFDAFAIGGLLNFIPIQNLNKKVVIWFMILAAFLFFEFGLMNIYLSGETVTWSSLGYPLFSVKNFQHVWSYSISNILFVSIILYLIWSHYNGKSSFVNTILANKVMLFIGKISYGVYVWHWFVLVIIQRYVVLDHNIFHFIIYYAVVIFVAFASYELFEKKFLSLKNVL